MGPGQGFADRVRGPALMAPVEIGEEGGGYATATSSPASSAALELQLIEIARLEGNDLAAMGVEAPADAEAIAPHTKGGLVQCRS